ncbi:MAG: AAA family ATPase, partial [Deltaproteobacteria bacterium]|nr:AAA family ATPase [Deltaproteobacteria bacterium]
MSIKDFRGIEDLKLEFNDKMNILVGINGVGKSSVLECAAILLSWLMARIRDND